MKDPLKSYTVDRNLSIKIEDHFKPFIGEPQWLNPYPDNLNPIKVKILRPCMFFAVDQEITLNKLGEYFTFPAIDKLLHDEYIKYIN